MLPTLLQSESDDPSPAPDIERKHVLQGTEGGAAPTHSRWSCFLTGSSSTSNVQELLGFIEDNLMHFRDWMPPSSPLRALPKPPQSGLRARDAATVRDLPTAKLDNSDSEIDELPLSRAELRTLVEKAVGQRRKKGK